MTKTTTTTRSRRAERKLLGVTQTAFLNGWQDGTDWDLDGFRTRDHLLATPEGWDAATINAVGSDVAAKAWGVANGSRGWFKACEAYNRAAFLGACAPQEERTGLPIGAP